MDNLKPCPFCGDPNPEVAHDRYDNVHVHCSKCDGRGPLGQGKNVEEDRRLAAEGWNTRKGDNK